MGFINMYNYIPFGIFFDSLVPSISSKQKSKMNGSMKPFSEGETGFLWLGFGTGRDPKS